MYNIYVPSYKKCMFSEKKGPTEYEKRAGSIGKKSLLNREKERSL
jgi:hypothetical protein